MTHAATGLSTRVHLHTGLVVAAALFALSSAAGAIADDDEIVRSPSELTLIKAPPGPFVTRRLAERLALLVIDEKYPQDAFVVHDAPRVIDQDSTWTVTVDNALRLPPKSLLPKRLTIEIRKSNGEIVSMS